MALLEDVVPQTQPEGTGWNLVQPQDIAWPGEVPSDELALKLTLQDTALAESWVQHRGLPIEWNLVERLYLAQVPIAYWEGTQVPRSHIGVPLVYEHVESLLPQIMNGLFSTQPPFESLPRPGTSMDTARANDALLGWQLDRMAWEREARLGLKYCFLYGNGIWKWGWRTESRTRKIRKRAQKPEVRFTPVGALVIPTPESARVVTETREEKFGAPFVEAVNIRHLLVDPGCRTSDIRDAKYVVHRLYMTVLELDALRDSDGYTIPERSELQRIVEPPQETPYTGALETRGVDLGLHKEFKAQPRSYEDSVDPLQRPLEVLEYWTADWVFTVLQRKLVIRKERNPFGRIPFLSVAFADVLDSFWGLGVGKLIGNEQRTQQGILNATLDDLALNLMGMYVRVRGTNTPSQQLRVRPGAFLDVDGSADNIQPLQRNPIGNAPLEIMSLSDARAQRITAAAEIATQGSFPSRNSSVTRTATGVMSLNSGTSSRLQALVESFSRQVFVPLLETMHELNSERLHPDDLAMILSNDLRIAYTGDPLELVNVRADFTVLAGSKLQAKAQMASTVPLLYQFLLTEPVMQSLAQEGKKVNVEEMVKMLFDVSGWPNRQDVIAPMTQQEQQMMVANSPAGQAAIKAQGAAQVQSQRDQNAREMLDESNVARAGREVIRTLLRNADSQSLGQRVTSD